MPPPQSINISNTWLFHITDVANLPGILAQGGLWSDAQVIARGLATNGIAHHHMKDRRLQQYRVGCVDHRFVGEFVPFYFCPRSPMLYSINRGNTGKPAGSQSSVIHLVSSVERAVGMGKRWAIADRNAGSDLAEFSADLATLDTLDWDAIKAKQWQGRATEKAAEFLVEDFFDWSGFLAIGCMTDATAAVVARHLAQAQHQPRVAVKPEWYYT